MRRYFALLVFVAVGFSLGSARAQDAGVDAGAPMADAAPAAPDATPAAPDGAVEYPPALVDDEGCDCAAGGAGDSAGGALLLAAAFLGLRRRR